MTKPAYDFDGLTETQLRVLGQISILFDSGHSKRILKKLETLGMIESRQENWGGSPPMFITRWSMPIHAHMAWCEWCAANVKDDET